MSFLEEMDALGVNTGEGLHRFAGKAAMYERLLGKFVANANALEVLPYLESGDNEKALENAHTLKGVTANLSITPLYDAYTEIVALLRADNPVKATEVLKETLPLQAKIIDCITTHTN